MSNPFWTNYYMGPSRPREVEVCCPRCQGRAAFAITRLAAPFKDEKPTGTLKCSKCHLVAETALTWPTDAYYQWNIRGYILWAWSTEHARALLGYLESTDRDPWRFSPYGFWMQTLPSEVTSAKRRDLVVKEISRTLADEA
jgi:hypothetical protein